MGRLLQAISLDRNKILAQLREIAQEALTAFPDIVETRLFGSLATGQECGLSDVDIFVLTTVPANNPLDRARPYFDFFISRLGIAMDVIVAGPEEMAGLSEFTQGSIVLATASGCRG